MPTDPQERREDGERDGLHDAGSPLMARLRTTRADREFPPPIIERWLRHHPVPTDDLGQELDYWARHMRDEMAELLPDGMTVLLPDGSITASGSGVKELERLLAVDEQWHKEAVLPQPVRDTTGRFVIDHRHDTQGRDL